MSAARMRPQVSFVSNHVIKRQSVEQTAYEVWKTKKAFRIANRTGQFLVPRILSFSSDVIVFERFEGFLPVRDYLRVVDSPGEIMEQLGRVLASIHRGDRQDVIGGSFLHQDFGAGNIYVEETSGRLMIIDWAPPFAKWNEQAYGDGMDDIVPLLSTFAASYPRSPGPALAIVPSLLKAFLRGYEDASNVPLNINELLVRIIRGRARQVRTNIARDGLRSLLIDLYRMPSFLTVVSSVALEIWRRRCSSHMS